MDHGLDLFVVFPQEAGAEQERYYINSADDHNVEKRHHIISMAKTLDPLVRKVGEDGGESGDDSQDQAELPDTVALADDEEGSTGA